MRQLPAHPVDGAQLATARHEPAGAPIPWRIGPDDARAAERAAKDDRSHDTHQTHKGNEEQNREQDELHSINEMMNRVLYSVDVFIS
jgi:hypothetical protein